MVRYLYRSYFPVCINLNESVLMFEKKIKWYSPSLKALILSGIFYFFARMFLKGAEKQVNLDNKIEKKKSKQLGIK